MDPATATLIAGIIAQITKAALDYARSQGATREETQRILEMSAQQIGAHVGLAHAGWRARRRPVIHDSE